MTEKYRSMMSLAYDQWLACDRCDHVAPRGDFNTEAVLHHHEKELLCLDRKSCERRARRKR